MQTIKRLGTALRFCLEILARFTIAQLMGDATADYFAQYCEFIGALRKN